MFKLETIKKVILTTICWLHIKKLTSFVPILNIFKSWSINHIWNLVNLHGNKYVIKLFLFWNVKQYNMVQFQEMTLEYTRKLVSTVQIVTFYIFAVRIWTIYMIQTIIIINIKGNLLRQCRTPYNWKTRRFR